MRAVHRVRLAANLVNGSTAAGILVAAAGRARLRRAGDGLLAGTHYRLPVPVATAFTVGSVIITRLAADAAPGPLLAHEARHASQYAGCGGLPLIPAYLAAAAWSWLLTGDFAARNVFERRAGLADGGYCERPVRARLARWRARLPALAPPRADAAQRSPGPIPSGRFLTFVAAGGRAGRAVAT